MKGILIPVLVFLAGSAAFGQEIMKAPVAKKVPKVLKIHGYEITDNYAWLRRRNAIRFSRRENKNY